MPEFTYVGDEGRHYPTLPPPAGAPAPGDVYVLSEDPGDGRWKTKGNPTVEELKALAEPLGIDTTGMKKADLLAAIEAKQAAPTDTEPAPVDTEES